MSYENRFEIPLDAGHLRNQRLSGGRTAMRTKEHPSDNEMIANHTALEIAYVPAFRLGVRWVAPAANEIDGMRIDAKAMDVLTALVAVAPGVVSTMQLMDRVWSRVVVGDNVVHHRHPVHCIHQGARGRICVGTVFLCPDRYRSARL